MLEHHTTNKHNKIEITNLNLKYDILIKIYVYIRLNLPIRWIQAKKSQLWACVEGSHRSVADGCDVSSYSENTATKHSILRQTTFRTFVCACISFLFVYSANKNKVWIWFYFQFFLIHLSISSPENNIPVPKVLFLKFSWNFNNT